MTKNLGSTDRVVRLIAGIALPGWGYATQNWFGAIGLIPVFTAATGWRPAYLPFRIKTNKGWASGAGIVG